MMKIKIFISRILENHSPFRSELNLQNVSIEDQSLIAFSPLPFQMKKCDWLFFYSKTGVKYFLKQNGQILDQKLGCFGPETAKYLASQTKKNIDFIGSGNREEVTQEFEKVLKNEICLFVVGQRSLRSVQILMRNQKASEIIVYQNKPKTDFEIAHPDIAIFTSPMAVETYFSKYPQRIHHNIAIGKTTYKKLMSHTEGTSQMAAKPSEKALGEAVNSYLNKF